MPQLAGAIGDGAITANATVVKNVEPYTIVGGNQRKSLENDFQKNKVIIRNSMVELTCRKKSLKMCSY
jgi:acetyltransferase-like isoleucine patch superfamily enzyme